jgi:hypothetical protein
MISLKEWMEVVGYRITEGSDYGWQCYGDNGYCLDSWNGHQDGHSFSIIFDTKTQEVYEVQAHDYKHGRAYRMIHPNYAPKYMLEAADRDCPTDEAFEGADYVDLETEEDWLEKASAIASGEDYDTRVSIPLDFTDEELLTYMKMAHEHDMTFNQFVEEALRTAIEEHKRDPEGMKSKADRWKAERDQETSAC